MSALSRFVETPVKMSTEEFLLSDPGDGRRWQLVDGHPRARAPTNLMHGALLMELGSLIRNHLMTCRPGCSILAEPGLNPRVLGKINVRIPDLAVTCSPYTDEQTFLADPLLVIEVLSPSNEDQTWSNVWTYASLPSVREILVVASATIGAHVLRRDPDGSWPHHFTELIQGDLVLDSIGFRAPLADLYRTTRLAAPPASG